MSEPYRVLLTSLVNAHPDGVWSSRHWHTEAALAQLKSSEIVRAHKRAVKEGYLEPVGEWVDGEWSPSMLSADHEAAKGRWVTRYRRTWKPLPGQPAEPEIIGQGDLLELVGGP
jgi:hypothetical protein